MLLLLYQCCCLAERVIYQAQGFGLLFLGFVVVFSIFFSLSFSLVGFMVDGFVCLMIDRPIDRYIRMCVYISCDRYSIVVNVVVVVGVVFTYMLAY